MILYVNALECTWWYAFEGNNSLNINYPFVLTWFTWLLREKDIWWDMIVKVNRALIKGESWDWKYCLDWGRIQCFTLWEPFCSGTSIYNVLNFRESYLQFFFSWIISLHVYILYFWWCQKGEKIEWYFFKCWTCT